MFENENVTANRSENESGSDYGFAKKVGTRLISEVDDTWKCGPLRRTLLSDEHKRVLLILLLYGQAHPDQFQMTDEMKVRPVVVA